MCHVGLQAAPKKIADGWHSSVVSYGDRAIAAKCGSDTIRIFTYNKLRDTWPEEKLLHARSFADSLKTMAITEKDVFVCVFTYSKCYRHCLVKRTLHEFEVRTVGPKLNTPLVRGSDDDGNVLIVDKDTDRLIVVDKHGQGSVVKLYPPVSWPNGAVFYNDSLFATSVYTKTIYKYI